LELLNPCEPDFITELAGYDVAFFVAGAAMVGLTHTDVVVAMLHEALARPPYDVPLPTPPFSSTTLTREAAVSS
jgi:hypothetical protein